MEGFVGVIAEAVRHMLKAGMSHEDIVGAISDMETAMTPAKTARQERNRRYYEKKLSEKRLNKTEKDVSDACDLPSSPKVSPHTPLPNPSNHLPPSPPKGGSSPADFDQFWSIYPNKVGKRDAEKAFSKAVKRADISIILAGLKAYVAKTDDRPWCNPATWLNQDRWEDRPATPPPRLPAYPPEPRNVGELTILEAKRGDIFDAPFRSPRLDDESDRNTGFAGTGIARRIAIAAAGRS